MGAYPSWFYFPPDTKPPSWVHDFVGVVDKARHEIDSAVITGVTSDRALAALRPGLVELGYEVEAGKKTVEKIARPVLFGDQGKALVAYEVDAVHDGLGIVVEVEAGRGARGNAVYRDLIRASLIVGARYLALGVMETYHHQSTPADAFDFRSTACCCSGTNSSRPSQLKPRRRRRRGLGRDRGSRCTALR